MNVKHHEKIGEAQIAKSARGYIDQFIWPRSTDTNTALAEPYGISVIQEAKPSQMTSPAGQFEMTPEERVAFRAFVAGLIGKSATPFEPIKVSPQFGFAVKRFGLQMEDAYEDSHPFADNTRPSFSDISGLEMSQLNDWSEGQFIELCKKWPKAAALLIMDHLDQITKLRRTLRAREPSFRAVEQHTRPFVFERRERRTALAT